MSALGISRSQAPAVQWHAAGTQRVLDGRKRVMSDADIHLA